MDAIGHQGIYFQFPFAYAPTPTPPTPTPAPAAVSVRGGIGDFLGWWEKTDKDSKESCLLTDSPVETFEGGLDPFLPPGLPSDWGIPADDTQWAQEKLLDLQTQIEKYQNEVERLEKLKTADDLKRRNKILSLLQRIVALREEIGCLREALEREKKKAERYKQEAETERERLLAEIKLLEESQLENEDLRGGIHQLSGAMLFFFSSAAIYMISAHAVPDKYSEIRIFGYTMAMVLAARAVSDVVERII